MDHWDAYDKNSNLTGKTRERGVPHTEGVLTKRTEVYFIRHADSDQSVHEDAIRPLSEKGMSDAANLINVLKHVRFDYLYSSPYLRAEQTVLPLAEARRMPIHVVWDFRERKVGDSWIDDYEAFARRQWSEPEYKLENGESIADAQRRNIIALNRLLKRRAGQTIAIGTHGGCLGAIINYYEHGFGYDQFLELLPKLPCVMRFSFIGEECVDIEETYHQMEGLCQMK